MSVSLEYHEVVNVSEADSLQRFIPFSLALLGICLFSLLPSISNAQISGVSPGAIHSVPVAPPTAVRVPPPTATFVPPPTGAAPVPGSFAAFAHRTGISHPPHPPQNNGNHPHHDVNGVAIYPYLYPVPYGADVTDPGAPGPEDANDQDGPAAGDPRNYGADAYVRPLPVDPAQSVSAGNHVADPPQPILSPIRRSLPPPSSSKTVMKIQLNNYAIVSQTLYDFTPGHPRKIALSDLDLPATQKQNDDRGVIFDLPTSSQTN